MNQNRLVLDGLAELREALRALPAELREDGAAIVEDAAEVTAAQLRQSYPLGETGNLRAGVSVKTEHSPFGTIGIVRSKAPHAHLWEFGTQNRTTRQGWRRGVMPSQYNQGLVGIATRNRRRMQQRLVQLLERAGFTVTGAH